MISVKGSFSLQQPLQPPPPALGPSGCLCVPNARLLSILPSFLPSLPLSRFPGVVQKPPGQVPAAAAAAAERGPEQGEAGQKEELAGPGSELGERDQRAVHTPLQHLGPHHFQQQCPRVHLEPGVHLPALRSPVHFFLLHAEVLPHDLHPGIRLQPRICRLDLLFRRDGLWILFDPYAPPAPRTGGHPESHGCQCSHQPPQPVSSLPLHPGLWSLQFGL